MFIGSVMPSNHLILCPFSSCLQSFPASGSFPVSQFFPSDEQSIVVSASASVLPMNIQDWFPLGLTGLFLAVQGTLKSLLHTTVRKYQFFSSQPSLWSNSHIHTWLPEKPYPWLDGPLLAKWCLCLLICCLGWSSEKAIATHSSTLDWKIPWAEEPGKLQSMGSLCRTQLSDFTFTFPFHALEKEMATHSSVLAWRIPGTGSLVGCRLWGSTESDTTEAT